MKLNFLFSALLFATSMDALARQCWNSKGQNTTPEVISIDLSTSFPADQNFVGGKVVLIKNYGVSGRLYVRCGIGSGPEYWYRHYVTTLPIVDHINSWNFIQLNDYMKGAIEVRLGASSNDGFVYPPATVRIGPDPRVNTNNEIPVTDNSFRFSLIVTKPFIGGHLIPAVTAFTIYASTTEKEAPTYPLYIIGLSGRVVAPQSCKINSGTTIELNFGNISTNDFVQAGAGNKPSSVAEKNQTVKVQCSNMQGVATLTMRLEAERAQGDMMVSNNPDIGFKLSDMNNKVLIPNNLNSVLPFTLKNDYAEILLKAWPVSITGKKPSIGPFNSRGILRIDFQ